MKFSVAINYVELHAFIYHPNHSRTGNRQICSLESIESSLIFQRIRCFITEIIVKFAVVVNYAELHAFVYRPSVSRIITIRGNLRQIFIPFDSISRREILHLALITASFLDTHTARELHEPGDNRFKPEKPT